MLYIPTLDDAFNICHGTQSRAVTFGRLRYIKNAKSTHAGGGGGGPINNWTENGYTYIYRFFIHKRLDLEGTDIEVLDIED